MNTRVGDAYPGTTRSSAVDPMDWTVSPQP